MKKLVFQFFNLPSVPLIFKHFAVSVTKKHENTVLGAVGNVVRKHMTNC